MNLFGLKLDADTHDIIVTNGAIQLVDDSDVIARNLKTRLQMFKGEWLLDTSYGYDFKTVFGQRVINLQLIESSLKEYILETENVVEITSFKLDYNAGNSRLLLLSFGVTTTFSDELITLGGLTIG